MIFFFFRIFSIDLFDAGLIISSGCNSTQCCLLTIAVIFPGAEPEFSVAEVRLQQGGLHPKFVPQAEGDVRPGFREHGAAASRDFQAQQLTEAKDE